MEAQSMATMGDLPTSVLTRDRKKIFGWKVFNGGKSRIRAIVRYDDDCRNGHNTFSITGEIEEKRGNNRWYESAGGCIHEEISEHFPKLAPLIKFHLCSSDGPLHYLSNTVFLAGDRDCYGRKAGDVLGYDLAVRFNSFPYDILSTLPRPFVKYIRTIWENGDTPAKDQGVRCFEYDGRSDYAFHPKFSIFGYGARWHEAPFDTLAEAEGWRRALLDNAWSVIEIPTSYSKGKERELDAARRSAIWPEATDAELCQEPDALRKQLSDRLPALLLEFRAAVESLGFTY